MQTQDNKNVVQNGGNQSQERSDQERKRDEELEDTFPASDPTSPSAHTAADQGVSDDDQDDDEQDEDEEDDDEEEDDADEDSGRDAERSNIDDDSGATDPDMPPKGSRA